MLWNNWNTVVEKKKWMLLEISARENLTCEYSPSFSYRYLL